MMPAIGVPSQREEAARTIQREYRNYRNYRKREFERSVQAVFENALSSEKVEEIRGSNCGICLGDFFSTYKVQPMMKTGCNDALGFHLFHRACLMGALLRSQNPGVQQCPACRIEIQVDLPEIDVDQLIAAAKGGNKETLQTILDKGADPNTRTGEGAVTLLHLAIQNDISNNLDAITFLLEKGADPNAATKAGYTPLHLAAQSQNPNALEYVTLLLDQPGIRFNEQLTHEGETPLHLAAKRENPEILQKLSDRGANIHAKTSREPQTEGNTPLHLAIENGRIDNARILLERGANIHAKFSNDYKVVGFLLSRDNIDREMLTLVLDHSAEVNGNIGGGMSALHWIFEKPVLDCDLASDLIRRGAKVNEPGPYRREALIFKAIAEQDLARIRFLVREGANLSTVRSRTGLSVYETVAVNRDFKSAWAIIGLPEVSGTTVAAVVVSAVAITLAIGMRLSQEEEEPKAPETLFSKFFGE